MNKLKFYSIQTYRILRRIYIIKFRKEYLNKSIKERMGKCNKCGKCCSITCPHFNLEFMMCDLWIKGGKDMLPLWCRICPIDEKDQDYRLRGICGYYWKKK